MYIFILYISRGALFIPQFYQRIRTHFKQTREKIWGLKIVKEELSKSNSFIVMCEIYRNTF